jgi:hypothetical protein
VSTETIVNVFLVVACVGLLAACAWMMGQARNMLDEAKVYYAAASGMFDEVSRLASEIDPEPLSNQGSEE